MRDLDKLALHKIPFAVAQAVVQEVVIAALLFEKCDYCEDTAATTLLMSLTIKLFTLFPAAFSNPSTARCLHLVARADVHAVPRTHLRDHPTISSLLQTIQLALSCEAIANRSTLLAVAAFCEWRKEVVSEKRALFEGDAVLFQLLGFPPPFRREQPTLKMEICISLKIIRLSIHDSNSVQNNLNSFMDLFSKIERKK
jgi:hypothetical protein